MHCNAIYMVNPPPWSPVSTCNHGQRNMFICGGDFIPIVDGISNRTANTFVKEIKTFFMLFGGSH